MMHPMRTAFFVCLGLMTGLGFMATAATRDAAAKPWLIPPHILEFTGPVIKLFGTNLSFGAKVSIIESKAAKGTKPSGGVLLCRDGNTIFEPDAAPIKAARGSKKDQEGDFGLLVVTLADRGLTYVVSEGVSGYTEIPMSREATGRCALDSKELGRERVQGYDCVKSMVAIVPEVGEGQVFLVWTAPKLRNFPVKIERLKGGANFSISFSDIRFERPQDSLFASPQGYKRYESLNAMTEEMTRRVWNVMRRPDPSLAFPPDTTRPALNSGSRQSGY
jgi:hypothetical protein